MEREISDFKRELDEYPDQKRSSTPEPIKPEPISGSKPIRLNIPSGRVEQGCGPSTGRVDNTLPENHDQPFKFVTQRSKKQPKPSNPQKSVAMKPATFDGTGAWLDYKAHFDACAELNGWTDEQKGLYLSVSLRGQAQGVFGNLGPGKHDYHDLVIALEERFAPPNQTELYRVQLRERRQKASESIAELGQDIRRLTNLAYPRAPSDVRETLAMEQFVDSLVNSDMRLKIKQARPADLNDAVRHAVELEAFYRAESKHLGQGHIKAATINAHDESSKDPEWKEAFSTLQKSVSDMVQTMNKLMTQQLSNQNKNQTDRRNDDRNKSNYNNQNNRPVRKCYICGSEKHLKRRCPKRGTDGDHRNNSTNNENNEKAAVNISGSHHAGLFIQAKLEGLNLDCLIDTGATLTLVSRQIWDKITHSSELQAFDREIISASGNVLKTFGKTKMSLGIHGTTCTMEVVVAEMDMDAILGLDFMIAQSVQIDLETMTLRIKGKSCPLVKNGKIGCFRVVVAEQVPVPGRSEVILRGKLLDWDEQKGKVGMLETSDSFLNSNRGMVARTLVEAGDYVPIRYANFSNESKTIYPGTNIATFSPVHVIKTIDKSHDETYKQVPEHLQDLYERSTEGMSNTQKKQVAKLFSKYGETFSKSDTDLGRTGIIEHKIPTGNASAIKQPMRRVPVHLQGEVDKQIDDMLENGIIQPSTSPWASGIVLVKKKDGTRPFCVDYRRLNDATIKDAYPLPRIDESLDQLAGSKWFSCLDLSSGYWQVEVDAEDKAKTAFVTGRGLF